MDTTTAAAQAGVTIATIRTWCRIGAVAATKRAGRWVIDAASLAYRIALGTGKAAKPKETTMTTDKPDREALKKQAEAARERILADLPLPELTGTPKQVAWATEIRARRLKAGFAVHPHRSGRLRYIVSNTQLGTNYIGLPEFREIFDTEEDAVRVLTAAVTTGKRTTAKWWIDTRDVTAPF